MNKKKVKIKMTIDMPIISAITSTSRPILDDFCLLLLTVISFCFYFSISILSLSIRNEFFFWLVESVALVKGAALTSRLAQWRVTIQNLEIGRTLNFSV